MICAFCSNPIDATDKMDWWQGEPIHDKCKSYPRYRE